MWQAGGAAVTHAPHSLVNKWCLYSESWGLCSNKGGSFILNRFNPSLRVKPESTGKAHSSEPSVPAASVNRDNHSTKISSVTCSMLTSVMFSSWFPLMVTAQTSAPNRTPCTENRPRFWICTHGRTASERLYEQTSANMHTVCFTHVIGEVEGVRAAVWLVPGRRGGGVSSDYKTRRVSVQRRKKADTRELFWMRRCNFLNFQITKSSKASATWWRGARFGISGGERCHWCCRPGNPRPPHWVTHR